MGDSQGAALKMRFWQWATPESETTAISIVEERLVIETLRPGRKPGPTPRGKGGSRGC